MTANNLCTSEGESAFDELETLLIFGMEKPKPETIKWEIVDRFHKAKPAIQLFKFDDREPNSSYTFQFGNNEREFTTDYNLLINHPSEIIGDGKETMFLLPENNQIKWMRIEPCRKPAKGFAPIGSADKWYGVNYRLGNANTGWHTHIKGYTAIAKTGKPVAIKMMQEGSRNNLESKNDSEQIILMCSIVEDAHRSNSFLVSTKIDSEILFPVGYESYIDFFRFRDGPRNTPTGRKNPIIHWVAKHMRQKNNGGNATVKRHLRGIAELNINGVTARITPNERYYV